MLPVGMPGGRSGKFALIFCSATMAASESIFVASSLTELKLSDIPLPCPASSITPLSMSPISLSSFSAAGRIPPIPEFTLRSTPMHGPSMDTTSPSSVTVFILRFIWSRASLAFMIILDILRISASSVA